MVHFGVEIELSENAEFPPKNRKREEGDLKEDIWNLFTINAAAAADVDLILDLVHY